MQKQKMTKLHIHVANAHACLERHIVQTTPMKRGRGEDHYHCKRRT